MEKINVAVNGAFGRMGREICQAVLDNEELQLAGAFDLQGNGEDIGEVLGRKKLGILIRNLSSDALTGQKIQVMVDFTTPMAVMDNIKISLDCGIRPVVGTTGITQVDLQLINEWVEKASLSAFIAPNFALGAVLMMKFAQVAARYFKQAEIIELHHDQKIDAPSGTSIKTAEMIAAGRREEPQSREELLKLAGARGAVAENVHIHSVRLEGLIAHQEVIFGGLGQTLSIRHDSYDRKSFMPGVMLAIKKVTSLKGLVYGLENLLDL